MSKKHWVILAVIVLAVVYVENHGKQLSNLISKVPAIGSKIAGR